MRKSEMQSSLVRCCLASMAMIIALLVFSSGSAAQSTTDGAIGGTVTDTTGAVVPNATIVVHNNATNAQQTVNSDASGTFRVGNLQPAVYAITVTAGGFAAYKAEQVIVNVGTVTEVLPRLKVGSASETVTVSGEAAQVNTTSSDFAPIVNETAVSNLPINGNRWSNFATLTPTVIHNGDGFGLISFRGMSVLLNNNTIDGADNNQAFFSEERGRTRAGYSSAKAAVQEFQVNTSNYSAEYGRSAGGVINTVTKSGTNTLHGEMYFYDRDNTWGAFNPFTRLAVQTPGTTRFTTVPYKPKDWRKISGFAIGGPIKKDKLFFFMAFDWYKRVFPGTSIPSNPTSFFTVPGATTLCPADPTKPNLCTRLGIPVGTPSDTTPATAFGAYNSALAGLASDMGPVPRYGEQFILFPKFDWQLSNKHRLSVSGNRMRWHSPAGIQTQATNTYGITSFGNDDVKDTWGVARLDSSMSAYWANELRFQYGRDFEFEAPQSPDPFELNTLVKPTTGPAAGYVNPLGFPVKVSLSGMTFGVPEFLTRPKYPDEKRTQVADSMTYIVGRHTLKFGIDFNHVSDVSQNLRYQFGEYSYSSILDYTSDLNKAESCTSAGVSVPCYTTYRQGFGPLGFEFSTNDYAVFAQDNWKFSRRLSLSAGLRWEYEQLPSPFNNLVNPDVPQTGKMPSDKHNFGPRIGFAWDVYGDGKTSFRGGYGIYYGRVINSTIYSLLTQTGILAGGQTLFQYNATTGSAAGALFPKILDPTTVPTSAVSKPSLYFFDSNFQLPQIHQFDLTFEHDFGWNTVVSLAYLGSLGRHLPSYVDTNLALPTTSITYTVKDPLNEGPLSGTYTIPLYTTRLTDAIHSKYGSMTDVFSGVNSSYNAMVFQLNHRMSRNLQFGYNVTWARAFDYAQNQQTFTDISDFLFPGTPGFVHAAYGRSQYDVPLRTVFHAVAMSPWHKSGLAGLLANEWQIAPIFQWQEGLPYSLQASGSAPIANAAGGINGSGTGSGYTSAQGNFSGFNYIPGIGRNTFRARNNYGVDLKISKSVTYKERYSAEFSAEGFNLVNHQNITGMQSTGYLLGGTAAAPAMTYCGSPATTGGAPPCNSGLANSITNSNSNFAWTPRQLQLGIRLKF
jgi:hypothetical protein